MIYDVARVRRLFTKFEVDTCKTKKDTSVHAQLRTLQLRSKTWFIMWHESGGYLQSFKSIHAKVKKIDLPCAVAHLVIEIQAMIYDAARVRRLCRKFRVNALKNKNFHFGGSFLGGVEGRGIGLRSISNLDWPLQWPKEPKYEFW